MTVQIGRHTFTITDYHRMRRAGILTEDDRVELINGEVRTMSPIGPQHAAIVRRLNALLSRQLPGTLLISVQDPIQLSDLSEPQPDIAVLRARADFYAQSHPQPEDVVLIIEVADTSGAYDRNEKLPRYAKAGIPEVWLVDISNQTIEQYTNPIDSEYHTRRTLSREQHITTVAVESLNLAVADVFG